MGLFFCTPPPPPPPPQHSVRHIRTERYITTICGVFTRPSCSVHLQGKLFCLGFHLSVAQITYRCTAVNGSGSSGWGWEEGGGGKDEDVIAHRGMQEAGECVVHARVTSGSESAGSAECSFSPDRYGGSSSARFYVGLPTYLSASLSLFRSLSLSLPLTHTHANTHSSLVLLAPPLPGPLPTRLSNTSRYARAPLPPPRPFPLSLSVSPSFCVCARACECVLSLSLCISLYPPSLSPASQQAESGERLSRCPCATDYTAH